MAYATHDGNDETMPCESDCILDEKQCNIERLKLVIIYISTRLFRRGNSDVAVDSD